MPILLTEGICESLTSHLVEILTKSSSHSVKTVVQFLALNHSKLRFISKFHNIDFQILLKIREELNSQFSPIVGNALQLYKTRINHRSNYETGIDRLDDMLISGIHCGEITEISGFCASGKTQLCYTLSLHIVTHYDSTQVFYIDTDLSFSHLRVQDIMQFRYPNTNYSRDVYSYLQKIKVSHAFDIYSLIDMIEKISHDLDTNPKSEFKNIGLLIIDSLTTPLSLAIKKINSLASDDEKTDKKKAISRRCQAVSLISQVAITLKTFALKHSIAVVVANSRSVTLKHNWKNHCALSLLMEKVWLQEYMFRSIKVTQSNRPFNDDSYCKFMISAQGITSVK